VVVGLGMDLVEVARARRMLSDRGERALRRLCTAGEADYCLTQADAAQSFAARLAAKEAAYKALAGTEAARGIGWRDIEVLRAADGRPSLRLHGPAATRAAELGVTRSWLTLTHTAGVAGAVVLLEAGA
jgi:holo-[acyl-carrier protein] synthase